MGRRPRPSRYHWLQGYADLVPGLAAELVRARPAVIVVFASTPGALALKAATRMIPIVLLIGPDPVAAGVVASHGRPGGNLTGVTTSNVQIIAKRLELLHQLMPAVTLTAFLVNPSNAAATQAELNEMQAAARALGLSLLVVNASTPAEIETAFATAVAESAEALLCRSHCARRETGRSPSAAPDKIRDDREPQDRQGTRPYGAAVDPAARRRGDRVRSHVRSGKTASASNGALKCLALVARVGLESSLRPAVPRRLFATKCAR
jgi:hypothetical protein